MARSGPPRQGGARQGQARQGKDFSPTQYNQGMTWNGLASQAKARQGSLLTPNGDDR